MDHPAPEKRDFARNLRKESTDAEARLWSQLRGRRFMGKKFRRQTPIGPYVVDFLCEEKGLIIELDGGQHNEEQVKAYDLARTEFLSMKGYRVIRFWDPEVFRELERVKETIFRALSDAPSPALRATSPVGRGKP